MLEEIIQNGPIVCSCSTPTLLRNHKSGIFHDYTGSKAFDHEVEIVGFGIENNTKYWHIKNTWGTQFGEDGFFKLIRGIDNIAIETNCSWAIPLDTWSEGKQVWVNRKSREISNLNTKQKTESEVKLLKPCRDKKTTFKYGEKINSPRPGDKFDESELPENFDWRNVFDFNYLSRTTNQNLPRYCDSCWAFASSSALADRFIIQHNRSETNFNLNVQVLLNCKAGGGCDGGNPGGVYEFASTHGIPDGSCFNYEAIDYPDTCRPFDTCRDCLGPPRKIGQNLLKNCITISHYERYFVSEYGYVLGKIISKLLDPKTDFSESKKSAVHYIKSEIISRGPISCGIHNSQEFISYNGGIHSQKL